LSQSSQDAAPTSNIIIERNTCVNWGVSSPSLEKQDGVVIGPGASCILRKNLFHGPGKPYSVLDAGQRKRGKKSLIGGAAGCLIADNISSWGCEALDGCARNEISFESVSHDNYENASGYGASGWWLKHGPLDVKEQPGEDDADAVPPDDAVPAGLEEEDMSLDDEAPEDLEEGDAIFRSFFMSQDDLVSSSREDYEDGLYEESEEN
jgi:hypothetical protein